MTRAKAKRRATSPGVGATLGGAVAVLIVWAGGLTPTSEQMGALTAVCGAALELAASKLRR